MENFKVTDKRRSHLITDNLNQHMSDIRSATGDVLAPKVVESHKNRENIRTANTSLVAANNRVSSMTRSSSTSIAPDKNRKPQDYLRSADIPFEMEDRRDRALVRMWCRNFYKTDSLIPLLVDIYARLSVVGVRLKSKDPAIQKWWEEAFDYLNYEDFMIDFGREFFQVGEAASLGHWNESLGMWQKEELINPDQLCVRQGIFGDDLQYELGIPNAIKQVVQTKKPEADYYRLVKDFPDIVALAEKMDGKEPTKDEEFEGIEVSPSLIARAINKIEPWDLYGTPHMMRSFQYLILQESLLAAQGAVADRLYSPFILAKLGATDLGDGEPWVPDADDIADFTGMMQDALAADFRTLVYHFGVDIKSVFGRESVPRFDQDFQRIQDKILQVWGVGASLIQGGSAGAGTYASSALNRDFLTQMLVSHQKTMKRILRERMAVVAEAQEMFDYDVSGSLRVPKYEEVLVRDYDTGTERIVKKPKLLLPEIEFQSMSLRDENTERTFLRALRDGGVPVSDEALMVSVDIDWKDELERKNGEDVQKVIAQAENQVRMVETLRKKGLPIPDNLKSVAEHIDSRGEQGEMSEEDAIIPREDQPKVNVDAVEYSDEDSESTSSNEEPEDLVSELPRNHIRQRPEESDEERKDAPREAQRIFQSSYGLQGTKEVTMGTEDSEDSETISRRYHPLEQGPTTKGMSAILTKSQVTAAIEERKWERSIKGFKSL